MQREIEKNATDIDNESLKLSQKVNELKKSNLTLENSIVSLSTSRHEDSKNISEMKQYIDKEILKVKESLKELVNRVPVKEKKLKAEKKQEEKLEKAKNAKKVDKPNEEFLVFRNEVKEIIDKLEENMYSHLKSSHYKIENSISALRNHTTLDLSQLKEKLYWLPVDLKELKGMPPTEARIFILEARLRSEENIRNDQYNKLLSLIDNLKVNVKNTSENFLFSHVLPSIASQSIDSKTPEVHRVTPSKRLDSIRSTLPEDLLKLKVSRRNRISMSVDLSKHSFRKKN